MFGYLKPLIKYKTLTIIIFILLVFSGFYNFKSWYVILPMQDNAEFQITIKAPVGINLESMKKKL